MIMEEKYKYLNQKEFDNLVAFIHEFTGDAEKLQMLLQSCMRLKIYLLWMREDTVLLSYSIIDHRKVLKMQ